MKISELVLNPANPRQIKEENLKRLVRDIKTDPGFLDKRPVLYYVDPDTNWNMVYAGNMRIRAATQLGMADIPAVEDKDIVKDGVIDQALLTRRIFEDNESYGQYDADLLANNFDLEELTALDFPELNLMLPKIEMLPTDQDDEVPEVPTPRTVLGDLYELGPHRVLCGDSTMIDQVERLMNGKKADMVFTDPPYGIEYISNAWDSKKLDVKEKRTDKKILGDENENVGLIGVTNSIQSLKENSHLYIWCRWDFYPLFKKGIETLVKIKSIVVWDKGGPGLGDLKGSYGDNEWAIFGMVGRKELKERQNSVWQTNRMKGLQMLHPTQKPIEICQRAILNSSDIKETVLDLFLGSGSTLITSEKTERICYGMELDPHYCDVIVQRYVNFTGNTKIKLNGKEITWDKTADK